jgi:hypothetical protein
LKTDRAFVLVEMFLDKFLNLIAFLSYFLHEK